MITPIDERVRAGERDALKQRAQELQALLTPLFDGGLGEPPAAEDAGRRLSTRWRSTWNSSRWRSSRCSNAQGPLARCRSMVELLEMKAMDEARTPATPARSTDAGSEPRRDGHEGHTCKSTCPASARS